MNPLPTITFSMKDSKLKDAPQIYAQMQTEMQGERQKMTTAEKEWWGAAEGRPHHSFSAVLILCQGPP